MANLKAEISIKDTKLFTELIDKPKDLIHQIEINDYKDSLGHELKMNKSYTDFKEFIGGLNENTKINKDR